MKNKQYIELSGVQGSPYTRKILALLRYRRIPYRLIPTSRWREDSQLRFKARPEPKVPLLPTFYFETESGDPYAVCDTTPIIRQLEELYSADRQVIPSGALGFINYLIEDYADEWLTKPMFHYRWHYAADRAKAGKMLPRWNNTALDDNKLNNLGATITAHQVSRLSYVGSNDQTKETIEQSLDRFLTILDKLLTLNTFILGERPSSCDFAIYGQLCCLALFDPTPQALIIESYPRLYAWTESLEDLSGYELLEDDWVDLNTNKAVLSHLLAEIGRVYGPYLQANAAAVMRGDKTFTCNIDGRPWQQNSFPYQAKCLMWLQDQFRGLNLQDKNLVCELFGPANLTDLLPSD